MNDETVSQVDDDSAVDTNFSWGQIQRNIDILTLWNKHYLGPCLICFLPMPIDPNKRSSRPCCMIVIYNSCELAARRSGLGDSCAFCCEPTPTTDKESIA